MHTETFSVVQYLRYNGPVTREELAQAFPDLTCVQLKGFFDEDLIYEEHGLIEARIHFRFDEECLEQAVLQLLKNHGTLSLLDLHKNLFLSDRTMLMIWGVSITTDYYVAGKGFPNSARLGQFLLASKDTISSEDGQHFTLSGGEIPQDCLSPAALKILALEGESTNWPAMGEEGSRIHFETILAGAIDDSFLTYIREGVAADWALHEALNGK